MKYLLSLFLLAFPLQHPLAFPITQAPVLTWKEVVAYAQHNLPHYGKLVKRPDGFVYLKVDDRYIHTLFPMLNLEDKGYDEPPYFRSKTSPGAHVSVFYRDEQVSPLEIGHTFNFTLKKIVLVHPNNQKASYAVLEVDSPDLEKLRKKYGVSPKLHGNDFHITLAKKSY